MRQRTEEKEGRQKKNGKEGRKTDTVRKQAEQKKAGRKKRKKKKGGKKESGGGVGYKRRGGMQESDLKKRKRENKMKTNQETKEDKIYSGNSSPEKTLRDRSRILKYLTWTEMNRSGNSTLRKHRIERSERTRDFYTLCQYTAHFCLQKLGTEEKRRRRKRQVWK